MKLDELLRGLRACIVNGDDEDAQENIFDLLRGLRCKDTPDVELTKVGLRLKELWKREQPTVAIQDEPMGTAPIDEAQAAGRAVRYTPGPWAWEACDASMTALGTSDGRGGVDLASEVLSVVRCKSCQKDPENRRCMMPTEADARLIAAAPELLEAIQDLVGNIMSAEPRNLDVADALAAIAKATGKCH